jgi:hypothetical protein
MLTPEQVQVALEFLARDQNQGIAYMVLTCDDAELARVVLGRPLSNMIEHRQNSLAFAEAIIKQVAPWKCQRCESTDGLRVHFSQTAYHWNGSGLNPNRPWIACAVCAATDDDYWSSMWKEYWSGQ